MQRSSVFLAALGLCVAAAPVSGFAEERPAGFYIGAGAGANIANDTETSGAGVGSTDLGHETGYAGVLSFGHAYANGFRAEVELGSRRNAIDQSGTTATGGSAGIKSMMVNGFYDFATGTAFVPYIGGGIGAGRVALTANPIGTTAVMNNDTALAVQGIAGVGYQIDNNWMGTLEYRYFTVPEATMSAVDGSATDVDLSSHSIMVGLRYTFGEPKKETRPLPKPKPMPVVEPKSPPPAPVAPPAPPPVARNYIVFFDFDRSVITPEAMAILRSAAENAKKGGISRIEATGHADRSGTQRYNLKLSESRALSVKAALSDLGVPMGDIGVDWKGELEPLVPTDDGVREPQNRRVEIVFP